MAKCIVCSDKVPKGHKYVCGDGCWEGAITWWQLGYEDGGLPIPAPLLTPTCYLCGQEPASDTEHVHPVHLGGSNKWSNLGAACSSCNSKKGTKTEISNEARKRLEEQQKIYRATAKRCQEVGELIYEDLIPMCKEVIAENETLVEEGGFRDEFYEEYYDWIFDNHLVSEKDDEHLRLNQFKDKKFCEELSRYVIDAWLKTKDGKKFDLWDDHPDDPLSPEESEQANQELLEAWENVKRLNNFD
jgi:5-methylcytosine-specific restriction endonuclease McrA